ncbi:hypothetical protein [Pedobacter boryungensis]|uniref:Uncharacterized protein n=1 Tax=Pedobacter boryungensis TaxID=869962 RepID=A0ABX2DCH5_9SPHI|nr:hypothetical protein [Pedobacter boryungensis]NQX31650.1 hypothetical protein [Pedobacter boryungensis]
MTATSVLAQSDQPDSLKKEHNKYVENYFNKAIDQQSRLINGRQYNFYNTAIEGFGYFMETRKFVNGTVNYDGFRFENVPLIYDQFKDLLISTTGDDLMAYSLLSERVKDFYVHDHHFVRVAVDSTTTNSPIRTGFYDLIHDGKIKVLVKRRKTIQENSKAQKYFSSYTDYFVQKDNVYYKISSESSFMRLFKEEKDSFRKQLKNQAIKFRKQPEEAMILLGNYYNTLSN